MESLAVTIIKIRAVVAAGGPMDDEEAHALAFEAVKAISNLDEADRLRLILVETLYNNAFVSVIHGGQAQDSTLAAVDAALAEIEKHAMPQ